MMKTIVRAPRPAAGRLLCVTTGLAVLLIALPWAGDALAGVRAAFDRPKVYEGDTVTLTIEVDGANSGAEPDLSPLARAFDVLGTSTGSQMSIINGRGSAKFSWRIALSPKTLGKIEVAPIQVGSEQTQPLTLTVSEMPQGPLSSPGGDVFVELELGIDGDQVMVQQQVPVVVRLYSAVPIRGGDLSAPSADGAVLERLGDDSQYKTQRNGRDYQVIERRYSLSPQRSGTLRIAPVRFEGELMSSGRTAAGDRFGRLFNDPTIDRMFGDMSFPMLRRGEPVRARSRALTLQVKPRAEGFGGEHWLPAEAVAIDDSWAAQPPRLRVGEPATRTLTITAKGLSGAQIPEIGLPAPAGMRAYPEKTETQSRTDGATLFGVSAQRVTLIPTAGGSVEMPEVRVTWWDTVAETERVATVPAMTLLVEGSAAPPPVDDAKAAAVLAPDPGAVPASAADASQVGQGAANSGQDGERAAQITDRTIAISWPIWLGLALLALAVGTLALPWYRRRRSVAASTAEPAAKPSSPPRLGPLREAVRDACNGNDAGAAARALLAWAQALWSDDRPVNLSSVAARIQQGAGAGSALAAEQVRLLERRLYAPDAGPWDGEALWLAVKNGLGAGSATSPPSQEDLAPLYPKRTS